MAATTQTLSTRGAAPRVSRTPSPGWIVTALVLVGLAIYVLVEARTGAVAARVRNTTNPDLRSYATFLGTDKWPYFFEIGSIVATVLFWSIAITRSVRRRAITPTLLLLVATTIMTDFAPIMNWAPYASYDPRLLHFPETWGWVSLAPTVEPFVVLVGYSYFFIIPAYLALAIAKRVFAHRPTSRLAAPLATTLGISIVVCVAWDGVLEAMFVRMGIYSYTQAVGSLSIHAGSRAQFPLYAALFFGIVLSLTAPMMLTGPGGLTWSERVAARRGLVGQRRGLAAVAIVFTVMSGVYICYGGAFAAIRETKVANSVARPWPFPTTKVYDPNGRYADNPEQGPSFDGISSAGAR